MFKKLLLVFMAIVMVFSFAACGNGNNDPEEIVTLTWVVPGDEQPDMAAVLEEVNKITEKEIGVRLDIQIIAQSAYTQKMKMMMASGGDFDLCFTSNWLNDYVSAARMNGLYDISDLVDKELKATMTDKVWEGAKVDGKLYAVPNNQVMFTQLAVGFRKDLVEKYNFDINTVNDIEDIEPFLELVKQNEKGVYPYNNRWFLRPWIDDVMYTVEGATLMGYRYDTGETVVLADQPEVKAAIAKQREWFQKGYIRPDFISSGSDANQTEINQGKYATLIEGWKPGMEYFSTSSVPYVYRPFTEIRFGSPTATMTAVSATCKYPEKAVEVIKLVNTNKEVYNLLCYGIEGKHYTLDAENKLTAIKNSGYESIGDWKYGNQFNAHISAGMSQEVWEETARMNDEAVTTPVTGFVFNNENVRTEVQQLTAGTKEYSYDAWITTKDEEAFLAKRNKAMKDNGIDIVFAEVKKQIEEYTKGK